MSGQPILVAGKTGQLARCLSEEARRRGVALVTLSFDSAGRALTIAEKPAKVLAIGMAEQDRNEYEQVLRPVMQSNRLQPSGYRVIQRSEDSVRSRRYWPYPLFSR